MNLLINTSAKNETVLKTEQVDGSLPLVRVVV